MIGHYNMLRQTYIIDGFQPALEYIQQLQASQSTPEQALINFYCYINIQAKFKEQETLQILNNCLTHPDCTGSILALTLYHIASLHFQKGQYNQCRNTCQQIIQKFIGLYYSIEMRLDKSAQEKELAQELQELIYYVFLMLSYVSREQNRLNDSNVLYQAGRRIIKDRQDVLSLTTKSSAIKTQGDEQQLFSPQLATNKKSSQKQNQNIRDRPGIKQTKSMTSY